MDITVIKRFDNYFSANILLTRLEANGLRAWLFDENTVTIGPFYGLAIGQIKLVVDSRDHERAIELLSKFEEEYLQSAVCPKCQTSNIQLVPSKSTRNFIATFLTWLLGNYAISPRNIYQCQKCGFESETLPVNPASYN